MDLISLTPPFSAPLQTVKLRPPPSYSRFIACLSRATYVTQVSWRYFVDPKHLIFLTPQFSASLQTVKRRLRQSVTKFYVL